MASTSKSKLPKRKHQCEVVHQKRNWLELPSDVMANILYRIGVVDILENENAQKVCTAWHKICKEPAMWRVIHMDVCWDKTANPSLRWKTYNEVCKHAVGRSQGQLVDITIVGFGNDELLQYVADRLSQLRRLEFACCFSGMDKTWTKALTKFPFLEELSLHDTDISIEAIETAGRCRPMLKTLKVNEGTHWDWWYGYTEENSFRVRHEKAIAIGEHFHELRHLELIGNRMTNIGLQAILDGCCHLESLDLRKCLDIDLKGDFGKRCSERIKYLKLPNDSVKECSYMTTQDIFYMEQYNEYHIGYPDYEDFTRDDD